jgi:hypothetical protein
VTTTAAPVDPSGRIVVSFSELDAFKQCPHKHDLSYVQRWTTSKDETTAAGRGTLWHKLMDAHYTAIKRREVPRLAVEQELARFRSLGKDSDTCDLLAWMYDGYVEMWGNDDEWQVLRVEHKVIVPLRYADGELSRFDLKMIVDLVVRSYINGKVWLVDHKSHAYLPKDRDLELDDQFGLYTWGLRQLGHSVFGSIYNTARTQRNKGDKPEELAKWESALAEGKTKAKRPEPQPLDARFDRFLMSRTDRELDTIEQDALATAETMYGPGNRAERHTNTDTCKWRCDYTEACLMGRKTSPERELVFLKDLGFRQDFRRH